MPIPVHNTCTNTYNIKQVYHQVIQTVLKARLFSETGWCLNQHEHHCHQADDNNIVINVLDKQTDCLLERWIMSFDLRDTPKDEIQEFIQTVTDFIPTMPAAEMDSDFYVIALNNQNQQCYSFVSNQDSIEFKTDSHLKANRFQLPSLSLEVVYEAYPKKRKKPIISLQSLSNPSFIPWSKMQQQQQQQQQPLPEHHNHHVHPLATGAPMTNMAISPPLPSTYFVATSPPKNTYTPMIAVRRLSRLSLSAIDNEEQESSMTSTALHNTAIPIPSPHMQYTHHHNSNGMIRSNVAYSTSPKNNNLLSPYMDEHHPHRRHSFDHQHSFVGSFEESLFSGRMSTMPSKPITFHCQIGVLGTGECKPSLKCPPHWSIVFPATFYKLPDNEDTTTPPDSPYVGTVDLYEHASTLPKSPIGYRIPPKGQLQVVIKNPNKTAVKLFLIPYDLTDMPKNTKTFLRQKSYAIEEKRVLRYAIHLQFYRNEKNRIYLYKSIRTVFANRKADAREKFHVVCEGPKEPVYISCK